MGIRTSGVITFTGLPPNSGSEAGQETLLFRRQYFPGRDCQDEKDPFTLASFNVNQWSLMTLDWFAEGRAADTGILQHRIRMVAQFHTVPHNLLDIRR